jgi:hypothetical protein
MRTATFISSLLLLGSLLGARTVYAQELFTHNYAEGAYSYNIVYVQDFLYEEGYFNGPITGYLGRITDRAIVAFQEANGLPGSGWWGPLTRGVANGIVDAQEVSGSTASSSEGAGTTQVPPLPTDYRGPLATSTELGVAASTTEPGGSPTTTEGTVGGGSNGDEATTSSPYIGEATGTDNQTATAAAPIEPTPTCTVSVSLQPVPTEPGEIDAILDATVTPAYMPMNAEYEGLVLYVNGANYGAESLKYMNGEADYEPASWFLYTLDVASDIDQLASSTNFEIDVGNGAATTSCATDYSGPVNGD